MGTTQPLHKRINTWGTSKLGCERIIEHYKTTCKYKFDFHIQIIVKLEGDGKDEQGQIDKDRLEERFKFEDSAIKSLRTIYPYGLNERSKDKITGMDKFRNIGFLFSPLPRRSEPLG